MVKFRNGLRAKLCVAILAVGVIGSQGAAVAQSAPDSVCLAKTDATGGAMRFVVLPGDAGKFETAGFHRTVCPVLTPEIVQGQQLRCSRLRGLGPEGKAAIFSLFNLTVADMCLATDAWASAMTGE